MRELSLVELHAINGGASGDISNTAFGAGVGFVLVLPAALALWGFESFAGNGVTEGFVKAASISAITTLFGAGVSSLISS